MREWIVSSSALLEYFDELLLSPIAGSPGFDSSQSVRHSPAEVALNLVGFVLFGILFIQ